MRNLRPEYMFGGPLRKKYQGGTDKEGITALDKELNQPVFVGHLFNNNKLDSLNFAKRDSLNFDSRKQIDSLMELYTNSRNKQEEQYNSNGFPIREPATMRAITEEDTEDMQRINDFDMDFKESLLTYWNNPFKIPGDIAESIEYGSQWINKMLGHRYTPASEIRRRNAEKIRRGTNFFPTSEAQRMKFALAEHADRNDNPLIKSNRNYNEEANKQYKDAFENLLWEAGAFGVGRLAKRGYKAYKEYRKANRRLREHRKDSGFPSLTKENKEEIQGLADELKKEEWIEDPFNTDEFNEQYFKDMTAAYNDAISNKTDIDIKYDNIKKRLSNTPKGNKQLKEIKDIEESSGVFIDSDTVKGILEGENIKEEINKIKEIADKIISTFQDEIKYYNSKGGIDKLKREGLDDEEIKEFKKSLKFLDFKIEKLKNSQGRYSNGLVTINPSAIVDIEEVIHHEINHLYQRGISNVKNQPISQKYWDKITFNKDDSKMLVSSHYSDLTRNKYRKLIRKKPVVYSNKNREILHIKESILENKYNIKNDNIFLGEKNPKISYEDIMEQTGYDEKTSKKLLKQIDKIEYKQVSSEPDSSLAEARRFMISNGDIKDKGSHISKELIEKYLIDYNSFDMDNILGHIEITKNNIDYLYEIFKNLKTVVPVIGAGAAAASMKKKDGISKYPYGGKVSRPEYMFGGPLRNNYQFGSGKEGVKAGIKIVKGLLGGSKKAVKPTTFIKKNLYQNPKNPYFDLPDIYWEKKAKERKLYDDFKDYERRKENYLKQVKEKGLDMEKEIFPVKDISEYEKMVESRGVPLKHREKEIEYLKDMDQGSRQGTVSEHRQKMQQIIKSLDKTNFNETPEGKEFFKKYGYYNELAVEIYTDIKNIKKGGKHNLSRNFIESENHKSFMKRNNISTDFTPLEEYVINHYTIGADGVNKTASLKFPNLNDKFFEEEIIPVLTGLIKKNKLLSDQVFYRLDDNFLLKHVWRNGKKIEGGLEYGQLIDGDEYIRDSFLSTSRDKYLQDFKEFPIGTVIHAPKGSSIVDVSATGLSKYPHQREVIFQKDLRFRVGKKGDGPRIDTILNPHVLIPFILGGAGVATMKGENLQKGQKRLDNIPNRREYMFGGPLQ